MGRFLGDDADAPPQPAERPAGKIGRKRGGGGKTGRGSDAAAAAESGAAVSGVSGGGSWKAEAERVLDKLTKSRALCDPFMEPVDPVALGLPDYFDVVSTPMDLGTVRKRLAAGAYNGAEGFLGDVALVFDNAMAYNPDGSRVHRQAKELQARLAQLCEALPALRAAARSRARVGAGAELGRTETAVCRYFSEDQDGCGGEFGEMEVEGGVKAEEVGNEALEAEAQNGGSGARARGQGNASGDAAGAAARPRTQ